VTAAPRRTDAAEAQVRLKDIYKRVRQSFAATLTAIDLAIGRLETGALNDIERRAVERAAHRLVGLAGTVGFPEATALARRIEEAFGLGDVGPDQAAALRSDAAALRRILLGHDTGSC
jgi:HPt (histidine-containing phosphotransfer) domain-containing protein